MLNAKSAVLFNRVSSSDQRDGFSLEAQKHLGERYAKDNGLKIVKTWNVDESASKELDRKHFLAMVEFIKESDIKEVVFDKIDRACRGMRSAVVIEELVETGVRFHFARDRLIVDKNSPSQEKLRFYLGVILGKYYIDNLKSEIHKGIEQRLKAGHWVGMAPIGYTNQRDGGTKKSVIVIDEQTAPFVHEIFELYATGNYGLVELAERLSQKVDRRSYTKRTIEGMLANPFYYGKMRVNGQILDGAHKSLVTKELWDQCQKIRGIRAAQVMPNMGKGEIKKPFMGMIKCSKCGHAVTGEVKKVKHRVYVYYHCANQACEARRRNIPEDLLWRHLIAAFEPFERFTPAATEAFLRTMGGRLEDLDLYTQQRAGDLAQKRLEIKKRLADVERLYEKGALTTDEYEQVVEIRKAAAASIEDEITAFFHADRKTFECGRRVIETFTKVYKFMTLSANNLKKIELAKMVLSKLLWDGTTLRYEYQNPFDDILKIPVIPGWWRRRESNPRPNVSSERRLHA